MNISLFIGMAITYMIYMINMILICNRHNCIFTHKSTWTQSKNMFEVLLDIFFSI